MAWQHRVWFPWLIICAVQIPCALGWSFLANTKRVYHEKDILEEELSKVKSHVPTPVPASSANVATTPGAPTVITPPVPGAAGPGDGPSIPDHELVRCIGKG